MLKLPKVYPITNVELAGISHATQIRELAKVGCRFVQIREKSASSRAFYDEVVLSLEIAGEFGMQVIVNDCVDIAIATKAHGVHLGQDDLPPAEARKLLGGGDSIIGYSTHSVEQALAAAKLPIDYLAIGPIFSTATKKNPDPVVGLDGLRRVRDAIGTFPLVAIGGIDISNLHSVLDAGADSAAVISDLFSHRSAIGDRFQAFEAAASV